LKTFYLTIDDGPSPDFPAKCSFLKQYKIPAIFFCTGENLEKRTDMVVDAIRDGFVIGNHSYSHPNFSAISIDDARVEITKTDEIIDKIYLEAEQLRPAKWFRFPYGDTGDHSNGKIFNKISLRDKKTKAIFQSFLRSLNYTQPDFTGISYRYYNRILKPQIDWHWTFDSMDWALLSENNSATFMEIIKRIHQKHPKDFRGFWNFTSRWRSSPSDEIILMHDHENSASFFPRIIEHLLEISHRFEIPGMVRHDFASPPLPR